MDISQAFRLLVVHPVDFDLLGIFFHGKYYINKYLPEGCSIACALFVKFATFLHRRIDSISGLDTLDHDTPIRRVWQVSYKTPALILFSNNVNRRYSES
jgi:hypothetical protein